MENELIPVQEYILTLFMDSKDLTELIFYGSEENAPKSAKLIIIPSNFFNDDIYGTESSLPKVPFQKLPDSDIPFLFGESILKLSNNGVYILHADLVASAYFMLSRYEEIVKKDYRDQYGRFLAKDSVIFQQGYGMRPLVDEWGRYLRNILRENGASIEDEKKGIRKIFLTHDVDVPFMFYRKEVVVKQLIKNILHYGRKIKNPLKSYFNSEKDPLNTFDRIIKTDKWVKDQFHNNYVESIYFLIAAGSRQTKCYCNIQLKKFQKLIFKLNNSGATLGLHVSLEAGDNPSLIIDEIKRLKQYCLNSTTKSRHHFLRWTEPEHISQMEVAGITEDFSLGYADSIGFRVGTCKPYYFINPTTKQISNIIIHPMQIMECSLDRPNYMGLEYEDALKYCKKVIEYTYRLNGELVLLFHNPIWSEDNYYGKLYDTLLEYVSKIENKES